MTASASPWGLSGRIALITGAAGGIGQAVVRALLDDGARVVATDLDAGLLADTWGARADDETLILAPLDVRQATAVDTLVADIEAYIGPIDCGVAVAGVLHASPVVRTEDADWERLMAVNATGVFHLHRALARTMSRRGRGALVTVSSNAAGAPRQQLAAYGASKAAATAFTRALALELAPLGVRCNVVAPGSTDTGMLHGMLHEGYTMREVIDGVPKAFRTGIPLGRIADPADVADSVLFLLSDRSRHITMAELHVDGGATQRG